MGNDVVVFAFKDFEVEAIEMLQKEVIGHRDCWNNSRTIPVVITAGGNQPSCPVTRRLNEIPQGMVIAKDLIYINSLNSSGLNDLLKALCRCSPRRDNPPGAQRTEDEAESLTVNTPHGLAQVVD